ncbi:beta-galactosidase [Microbacterium sp. NPDC058345]|uniref:beta-galactosidase n=1 Tax=Microbacterium sp. NPDC058345 TaxID=3346455 RepID=UPI003664AC12
MIHHVRHRGWPAPASPSALPEPAEAARGITMTDRAVLRHGVPIVPVSGEIHYSRLPRERWGERLRQMRANGVTVASAYVLWLHHSPERGVAHFDGARDVAAFIDECAAAGLEVVLRIGPWAHGEARNGGFPDWVADADVAHRSDDPRYLELVRAWFAQLAGNLDGRAQPGGPVIAIQLENELYDRPGHLLTLKRMAQGGRDGGAAVDSDRVGRRAAPARRGHAVVRRLRRRLLGRPRRRLGSVVPRALLPVAHLGRPGCRCGRAGIAGVRRRRLGTCEA